MQPRASSHAPINEYHATGRVAIGNVLVVNGALLLSCHILLSWILFCFSFALSAAREDHLLPYCADQRHPPDTLFFIAEEDWRLKEAHCRPVTQGAKAELPADLQQRLGAPQTIQEVQDAREGCQFPRNAVLFERPAEAEPAADQAAPDPAVPTTVPFDKRGQKPKSEEFTATSSHITNLVKIMSESSRAGAGDLLWLSWNPRSSKRLQHPTGSSGLIALTAMAARKLVFHFEEWFPEPDDWDVALRKAASSDASFRQIMEAGYTYPAIGHFREHASPNCGGDVRSASWERRHILQDTMALGPVHNAIEICAFTETGHKCVVHPGIRLPETASGEDFRWWTASISIQELPAGCNPTAAWANKWRAASRHNQSQGIWVPKEKTQVLSALTTGEKDDHDPNFPPLETSQWQIWDEYEEIPSPQTASFLNRWRKAQHLFNLRSFTNDPQKAIVP